MVEPVTPRVVAPPLLPVYLATHGGAYTDHVTCFFPGPQRTPLRATPLVDGATGPEGMIAAPLPLVLPLLVPPMVPGAPPAATVPGAVVVPVRPLVVPCC